MKATNNPLSPMLRELLTNLNKLQGLLVILKNRLNNFRKQIIDSNIDLSHLTAGSYLVITKLTGSIKDGCPRCPIYYKTGIFITKGENYLETLNQIINRESVWTISQGYERFESFLYDIVTMFLVNNYKSVLNNEEWRSILKRFNNLKILKKIQEWAPNFEDVVKNNNRRINLFSWYSVISEVRHAGVHSNLIIKNKKLQKILQSQEKKAILEEYFPGERSSIGYEINLNEEEAELNLKIIGELAVEIFNNLSAKANYDYKIEWWKQNNKK